MDADLYFQDLLRILRRRPFGYQKWDGARPTFVFLLYAEEIEALINATPEQRALAARTAAVPGGRGAGECYCARCRSGTPELCRRGNP